MDFKPKEGFLLVKPDEAQKETAGGILIPDNAQKDMPISGVVVKGNEDYSKGDRILFSKYGFDEVKLDDETLFVVNSKFILGIFI